MIKAHASRAAARREAGWYRRARWAAPRLLHHDGRYLVIERLPTARERPDWKPVAELRSLIVSLLRHGYHHRDVHVGNIVRGSGGKPLLIDWETAIECPAEESYDLVGTLSGVPIPEIHKSPQYWSSWQSDSVAQRWYSVP